MKFRIAHFEILYFEASPQDCIIFYNLPFKNNILFDINISSGGKDILLPKFSREIIYLVIDGDLYWFIYTALILLIKCCTRAAVKRGQKNFHQELY